MIKKPMPRGTAFFRPGSKRNPEDLGEKSRKIELPT
jgi:hypothetical protein